MKFIFGVDMNFKIHKTAKSIDKKFKSVDIISQENDDPNHLILVILVKIKIPST